VVVGSVGGLPVGGVDIVKEPFTTLAKYCEEGTAGPMSYSSVVPLPCGYSTKALVASGANEMEMAFGKEW
jgi:hypothetical protein